jgi:hypothetical protein
MPMLSGTGLRLAYVSPLAIAATISLCFWLLVAWLVVELL